MKLKSLGRRTDLIFAEFSGEVLERDGYWVIRTASNPQYHWGNYLIFESGPKPGDTEVWNRLFDEELVTPGLAPTHRLLTWDAEPHGTPESVTTRCDDSIDGFQSQGMRLETAIVLTCTDVQPPPRPNHRVEVRPFESDADWNDAHEAHVESKPEEYELESYREFSKGLMKNYRAMSEAGLGFWYGAFLEGQAVGSLGIYHKNGVARYQQVTTRPAYRRQGVCGTLVERAASHLQSTAEIRHFVMEADPEYHAARVYESVGFQRREANHALYWHQGMES